MNLDQYHCVPYLDGGRVVSDGLDCWGLVREILHKNFGAPLLNSFADIHQCQHSDMTRQFTKSVPLFEKCKPCEGAVACCFYCTPEGVDVFHHVGIMINSHEVMHTSSARGVSVLPLRAFKRLSNKVEFYKYVG